jgi:phosphoribosylformylglycinamidine synthase
VGIIRDYNKAVTQSLKAEGDKLYLIGPRFDELGGSEYYRTIYNASGGGVPQVRFELERSIIYATIEAIDRGLVAAAHDISNGGLACTVCEMAFAGSARHGLELDLDRAGQPETRTDTLLFSESSGFVMEARAGHEADLKELLRGYGLEPVGIGMVTSGKRIAMKRQGGPVVDLDLEEAKGVWRSGLVEAMR